MFRTGFVTKNNKVQDGSPVIIIYRKDQEDLTFDISSVITKKSQSDLGNPKQFELLNRYLDYKGEEFKDELYKHYYDVYEMLGDFYLGKDLNSGVTPPYQDFAKIFKMFDIEDIYHFLKNVFKLNVPGNLPDVFDNSIIQDRKGTREQTFIKDEYIYLAALIVLIKATFPIVTRYAEMVSSEFKNNNPKQAHLFKIYTTFDHINHSVPMEKLYSFTEKLVNTEDLTEEEIQKRVIELVIPSKEMIPFRLGQLVLHKLPLLTVVDDNRDINIVKAIYTFIITKLKSQYGSSDSIKQKTVRKETGDQDGGGNESHMEAYKIVGDLRVGEQVKLREFFSTTDHILHSMCYEQKNLVTQPIVTNNNGKEVRFTYQDIYEWTAAYANHREDDLEENGYRIHDNTILLLTTIFKGQVDPRFKDYLNLDNVRNMITLGFMYLWNLGFKDLALLLFSTYNIKDSSIITITTSSNKSRIPDTMLQELESLFPLRTAPTKTNPNGELLIKSWVEELGNSYYSLNMISLAPEDLIYEVFGRTDTRIPISKDLKVMIAEYLIKNEKIIKNGYFTEENDGQ